MTPESRVDYDLLLVFGLRKLDQEDLGGEVVDIRDSESDQGGGQLVSNNLYALTLTEYLGEFSIVP